jgi:hypothetical protein
MLQHTINPLLIEHAWRAGALHVTPGSTFPVQTCMKLLNVPPGCYWDLGISLPSDAKPTVFYSETFPTFP